MIPAPQKLPLLLPAVWSPVDVVSSIRMGHQGVPYLILEMFMLFRHTSELKNNPQKSLRKCRLP